MDCNSLTLLVILHLRKRERKTWRLSNRKANEEGKKHVSIVATSKRIKKKACEYCSKRRRKKACQFCKDTTQKCLLHNRIIMILSACRQLFSCYKKFVHLVRIIPCSNNTMYFGGECLCMWATCGRYARTYHFIFLS